MTDEQATKASEPRERAFHDPAVSIAAQRSTVLECGDAVVPVRHDEGDAARASRVAQRVAVVATVGDEADPASAAADRGRRAGPESSSASRRRA